MEQTDPLILEMPWHQAMAQMCRVKMALGYARVMWPSGRVTLEQYAGNVVLSDLEWHHARNPEELEAAKVEHMRQSMAEWRARTSQRGLWIRSKRRKKPRVVTAVEWIHPNAYDGPAPGLGGVIDAG